MSYRSDLECMSGHMVETTDGGGNLWFTPENCHKCDSLFVCRRTLSKYAGVINENNKIKEVGTVGDVMIWAARSIGK